jgi:hypothetical protein
MKITLAVAALFVLTGAASQACAPSDSRALSAAITDRVHEIVALDEGHVADVMAVMQRAAVAEYHAGPRAHSCARQVQTLNGLAELSGALGAKRTAMLAWDQI